MTGPSRTAGPGVGGTGSLPVWRLLDLGEAPPVRAQAFVEAVAPSVAAGRVPNTLVLVRPSSPYISLGFHQSRAEELDPDFLDRHPMPVLRRVEGGGTTYLDRDQVFYQLAYRAEEGLAGGPPDLGKLLAAPAAALRGLGVPAALRPPSDLVVGERKISGNAGGEWEGAQVLVGGILGRSDVRTMADLLRVPFPSLRGLVRQEVDRWLTSWERETGGAADPRVLAKAIVDAYRTEGLFDARPGSPTTEEERRFREETVPRHADPAWQEAGPSPRAAGGPVRRLRIAGPHGLLVFAEEAGAGGRVAVVDGRELREGYRIPAGAPGPLLRLEPQGPEFATLRREVANAPGFD